MVPVNLDCDGDTIVSIELRRHPPSSTGAAAQVLETTTEAMGVPHVTTRADVVRAYLRVREGGICRNHELAEAERVLRSQPFIASASIRVYPAGENRVRLTVSVVDEFAWTIGGRTRNGGISAFSFGTQNLDGRGLMLIGNAARGFAYRNGYGVRSRWHGVGGNPDQLGITADRQPLGHLIAVDFQRPFLTELQKTAFHFGITEVRGYGGIIRPAGSDLALENNRRAWDAGVVRRIGAPRRGRAIGIAGVALVGERVETIGDPVVISDTGLARVTDAPDWHFPTFQSTRVGAIGGIRALRFAPIESFDALRGRQDLGIGVQAVGMVGPSLATQAGERDIYTSGDLYLGGGHARSFAALHLVGEARRIRESGEWRDVVASARLSTVRRPSDQTTQSFWVQYTRVNQLSFPVQLGFRDIEGGVLGYNKSREVGGSRMVVHLEQRRLSGWRPFRADLAGALFVEAGRVWKGEVPYGVTSPVRSSLGIGLMSAYPSGGKRTYRLDLAVPLSRAKGDPSLQLRFSSADRTRSVWEEPRDLERARSRAVPRDLLKW